MFANHQVWSEQILEGNEKALAEIAAEAGFLEPAKTAANLVLLEEVLTNPQIIVNLAQQALTTADPDQALNNLERLCGIIDKTDLPIILVDETATRQLLTILGASPFLTGILCRRKTFFSKLFRNNLINTEKTEQQMCAELRQLIADDADTAALKQGLRIFKA